VKVDPLTPGETLCHKCGTFNNVRPQLCDNCGEPVGLKHKHDQQECQERGMSYSVPLKVKIRLTVYDKDPETGTLSIRDIKEEEVFFGEIPLMTDNGTFIINGTERVIVSQLHRSPGVFFKRGQLFVAKIIPYRGSWVEFEYDQKNLLYVRVGKRKFLATIFLRALGVWLGEAFKKKTFGADSLMEDAVKNAAYTDEDVVNTETGEVIVEANNEIMPAKLQEIAESGVQTFAVFFPEGDDVGVVISQTLKKDTISKPVDALLEIYRKMRPGDPPT